MKLVWTKTAQNDLYRILEYLEKEFGEVSKKSFELITKDFTIILKEFPEMGTLEVPQKSLRGFQLTRQTKIFYRLKKDQIVILALFDSRRDPKKRPR